MKNILTIDIEDYFQVENFKKVVKFSDWENYESRVERNTDKVLDILAEMNVKATFFVLGWIAERFPGLIKKIDGADHEIANHGYSHQTVYSQTVDEFRDDLRRAKNILEEVIQKSVLGYRAPSYSVTKKSMWALDVLMEEGVKYDSSIFPIYHDHGGLPGADRYPYKIYNNHDYMWEFPISTVRMFKQNIPFSGGGYFRLLPYGFIKCSIEAINREGQPAVIYLHPWELDPEQPRIEADSIGTFRHYLNLSKMEGKLKRLLNDFRFVPMKDYL